MKRVWTRWVRVRLYCKCNNGEGRVVSTGPKALTTWREKGEVRCPYCRTHTEKFEEVE